METRRDHQGERLISAGKTFELGFFTPDGSSDYRRYIGIWYYGSSLKTVVWVANRDSPLNDTTGVFGIGQDGNLMLSDGNKKSYWSTGLGGLVSFRVIVKLMDSGNLVLSEEDENSGLYRVFWQSFDNPTDTFLPGMKMDENLRLVSWKSKDDPATGSFRFQEDPKRENQYKIIKDKLNLYWKSDTSGKFTDADDIPSIISTLLSNSSGSSFSMGNMYHNSSLNITKTSLLLDYVNRRLVMNFDGKLQCFIKDNASGSWNLTWREPKDKCSVFKACGEFAICRSNNNLLCSCLPGFMPISLGNWNYGDFSEGCKRKTPLCSDDDNKIKEFVKLEVMKVGEPDWTITVERESKCLDECLRHCDCQAYLYKTTQSRGRNGNGTCWIWSEDVNNIQEDYKSKGDEIYLRVSRSDIGGAGIDQDRVIHGRELQWPLFVAVTAVSVTILLSAIFYIYLQRKEAIKQDGRESSQRNVAFHSCNGERRVMDSTDSSQFEEENEKVMDLHFFDFDSILAATDNFSEANKLGKGGFGSVYKGKFSSGQEIAVKRLSTVSGQGQEEFKNEIVLIARLQHRNLVRLLGYCIAGGEKILLYEYMPNKSLDSFIFDTRRCVYMGWEMRFSIILGIARGLLYLHQDSRLRIIHRDLKTSNILLDAEMNPKISDFGLARIFEGTQTEGITKRVVGTYGYMSPEYALDGFFSIKSDVFSFGIVLLEIISGKKNTGFYNSEEGLSLLGHAWRFWQEGNALEIMDKNLRSSKTKDILKCINIGLLCVQENPNDRPTMSEVVIMLSSETANLPSPKQPGFIERRIRHSGITYSLRKLESHAHLTSTLEGR